MPFDPKLISADDEFFGDDEKLSALGEQLRDDSAHLAKIFPPQCVENTLVDKTLANASASRSISGLGVLTTAALTVSATVLFGLLLWRTGASQPVVPSLDVAPAVVNGETVAPETIWPDLPTKQLPVIRPVSHQALTGPEWEAVLDLLESESQQAQSISL